MAGQTFLHCRIIMNPQATHTVASRHLWPLSLRSVYATACTLYMRPARVGHLTVHLHRAPT
eukprot:2773-Eustigmatos_ZCMA.PRE.1